MREGETGERDRRGERGGDRAERVVRERERDWGRDRERR